MSQARDLGDAANKANFLDNVTSDIQTQIDNVTPAGTIITFGGTTAPTGYLACSGQQELISDYPALYAALGTTWGTPTNPAAYFKLPDLRGAFLRGAGSNGTHNMANGNDFAGQAVGSFENDQFQGHRHQFKVTADNAEYSNAPFINVDKTNSNADGTGVVNGRVFDPITDGSNGTPRTGDETRPFNASILYCIKT